MNTVKKDTPINAMVKAIVKNYHPDRVILFGSHATGTAGPDSDVDLLVIMPVQGSKRNLRRRIRTTLNRFQVPKDILVSTPEEFHWRKDVIGTIEYPADREGKELYART